MFKIKKNIIKASSAIEGMGMYLIAVILAVLTIITLLYFGSGVVNRLYHFFKDFFQSFLF